MNSINRLLFITIMIIFIFSGCGSKRINIDTLVVDGTEMRVYEIFGMDCPGCHGGLENLVNEIKGVVASQANWEKQQLKVIVSTNTEVTDDAINEAIKKANFTPGKRLK